ncbi:MAG: sigma 54-interacting transcriptional regulator [bacterium]
MIIGHSPQIEKIKNYVNQLADTDESFLLIGEPGTGKKTIVKEIHQKSNRKNDPLIYLNCSSLGAAITESDLFSKNNTEESNGIFDQIQNGILCLENIDETPSEYQKLFFSMLKDKKFVNPFSKEKTTVTFRTAALTTNHNIKSSDDIIRKDLLSLVDNYTITVPPLKDRKQDIPLLFNYFLEKTCNENKKDLPVIPENLIESIIGYNWPGNIAELEKSVQNILSMSPEGELDTAYLPFEVKKHPLEFMVGYNLPDAVDEVEKYLITKTLKRYAGHQTYAAKALNISEGTLRYKMKKYNFDRKAFKD